MPISMHLKLRKDDANDEDEDVNFGFHNGQSVHLVEVTEELLVLALPMIVRCPEDTACHKLNANKNWIFGDDEADLGQGDERFKLLRSLKIHCLLYTSPSPRDQRGSRMPSSA